MSKLHRIPVTDALKVNYDLLRSLVGVQGIDWIVVRTNPNCEIRAAESLSAAGLIAWLPMLPVLRKNNRTRNEFDKSRPLCTRYLFVALDRYKAQSTGEVVVCDGVEKVLSFDAENRPHVVPKAQMRVIVDQCWAAITEGNLKKVKHFDIGAPFGLLADEFDGVTGRVTGYDVAKGIVEGLVPMFGREMAVKVAVDKVKELHG